MTGAAATVPSAQVAFVGRRIATLDADHSGAEVVVVVDGRIAAVGPRALLERYPDAQVVALGDRLLVPGFIDAHQHLSVSALHPRFGDATAVRTPHDLRLAVAAHAVAEPDVEVLRLHGWDDTKWEFPLDRRGIDAIVDDRPVVIAHSSLHQCVVNTAALDLLAIGSATPDPAGGEIARGTDGSPTGLLVERAWSDAHARSLAPYADPDRWAEHVAARAATFVREGITAVHDAACSPAAEALFTTMAKQGSLPVSVLALPHPAALLRNEPGSRLDGRSTGEGDEWFRVGPIKLFADGGIAIALDTSIGGSRVTYGYVMDDLEACAHRAADRGFRIAVHAIGNVGVDHALASFAAVDRRHPGRDHRFRLEHAGVSGPEQWRRAAALGVIGVVQPGFVEHVGISSHGVGFDDHHWLAFASLADAGVRLAGSSDDPCAPAAPLWCIDKGITRRTSTGIAFDTDQSIPFDDWLRAYTIGAALAGGQERERGTITPGKRADLVELTRAGDAYRVAATWIGGCRVWAA